MASAALTLVIKNWKEDQEREKKVLEVCVGGDWGAGEEDTCRERRSGGEGTGEGVQGMGVVVVQGTGWWWRGQGEFEGTEKGGEGGGGGGDRGGGDRGSLRGRGRGRGRKGGGDGGGTSRKCPRGDPGRGQQKQSMNEKDVMKHITLHG